MVDDSTPVVNEKTEVLVVRLQTLYRARRARRQAVELANGSYLKCWDAVSGLAYYCNLRTGLSSWKKPLLLAARDPVEALAPTISTLDEDVNTLESKPEGEAGINPQLSLKDRHQQREESLAFKKKCEGEKRELMLRHRRKIARAMRRFDKDSLDEKSRTRQERQTKLKQDNQQLLQDLYDGKKKENVETIREAAMRGNLDRIEKLLDLGFSVDAESAMGLTPLLAACQSGHLEVVRRLLSSGANVNHAHVKTGRTALMEAASRAKPPVLKELLRYGARIHVEDAQGETVFDCLKDAANREIVERACQIWSSENAALFPIEFRQVSLVYALISKWQRGTYEAERVAVRRDLAQLKQVLQRKCVEAKVRYDQDVRGSSFEPTLMRRLSAMEAADSRYDDERRALLLEIQDAVDKLRDSEQSRFIPEAAILTILSFSGRHWFDADPLRPRIAKKKKATNTKVVRTESKAQMKSGIAPTKLRPPPDQLPGDLEDECSSFQQTLKELCDQLQTTAENEHFDSANGVSRDASATSLATLDVFVEQAESLPYRDPRIGDMIDPYVRVFLRPTSVLEAAEVFKSDLRISDRNPVWEFRCQLTAVPSVQRELGIQVVDTKREDVAGEATIPLRSLLDQKDHNEWHVMPPTLRQQILEKKPREQPARIRVCVRLIHTKVVHRAHS
ncbi:Ankyrin repeat domain-containing protein 50 [Phytophthora ramorum]|uniref:Ankyrin repeat domain-containing protein 50 n=1 Tax=Phytophthora ramorum TaxID=164328 RepID=UPI0030975089|nr:Ankyrin repeat domain-containing protein 50 [Phytophthora ramorum]